MLSRRRSLLVAVLCLCAASLMLTVSCGGGGGPDTAWVSIIDGGVQYCSVGIPVGEIPLGEQVTYGMQVMVNAGHYVYALRVWQRINQTKSAYDSPGTGTGEFVLAWTEWRADGPWGNSPCFQGWETECGFGPKGHCCLESTGPFTAVQHPNCTCDPPADIYGILGIECKLTQEGSLRSNSDGVTIDVTT